MFSLLIKVIPLDLAATLSPGIFAVALFLLGGKQSPKARTFSLFLGIAVVGLAISLIGFFLGQNVSTDAKQTLASAIIDLALGAVLVHFGIKQIVAKERTLKKSENNNPRLIKWFLIGFLASATNFDAILLILTASKEVGSATDIGEMSKIIILIINALFFALPAGLPLLLYIIMPDTAVKYLTKVNSFVYKYSKYFLFAMFMIFGVLLLYRGIKYFV